MRQLILVVVLVAAAFLGGAFVNGPGLQWLQTRALRTLGLNNGGEIPPVDFKSTASSEANSNGAISARPDADAASAEQAPIPSFFTEDDSSKQDTSDRPSRSQAREKSVTNDPSSSRSQPSPAPSSPKQARARALAQSPGREPIPTDTGVMPASAVSLPAPTRASNRSALDAAPAIIDSLAALLPTNPPSSDSSSTPSTPSLTSAPKSIAGGTDHWAILEHKMQSLGVSRYTMEGEPGGRVVFSCLIPLAGRQAVAQRFEADGDDMVHAAQAALRRIALWRATQSSPP